MNNLIYKEFKLSINKFYFIIPFLTGALFLIPQWLFFLALMYFFFISVPNLYSTYNSQNDNGFSIMMPVRKSELVKARIAAFIILEMVHLLTGAFYAFLNISLYKAGNFVLDLNFAFFGIAFTMFALFNIIFFPLYYKTAYNYGIPAIIASIVIVLYITCIELLVLLNPRIALYLEGSGSEMRIVQMGVFLLGIIIFAVLNLITYRISIGRFEKVEL